MTINYSINILTFSNCVQYFFTNEYTVIRTFAFTFQMLFIFVMLFINIYLFQMLIRLCFWQWIFNIIVLHFMLILSTKFVLSANVIVFS